MALGTVKLIDTFFMMVAVVPMSKMLSSIFMKMAIRNGTVNNEKWAALGLGTLGAVTMMMTRGGMLGKMTGMGTGQNARNINGHNGTSGGDNSGSAANAANSMMGGIQPGGSAHQGASSGPVPGSVPPIGGATGQGQQGGVRFTTRQSNPSQGAGPVPGTVPPIGSTNTVGQTGASNQGQGTGEQSGTARQARAGESEPPKKGQRTMQDIVTQSSEQSNKFAKGAAKVGVVSSFAAPEVAPAMAGIYAAAGKATSGFATTAYHTAGEIKERCKNGQSFSDALQKMTGSDNMIQATKRASATLLMSPFGARATNFAMKAPGTAYQWARVGKEASGKAYQWAKNKNGKQ